MRFAACLAGLTLLIVADAARAQLSINVTSAQYSTLVSATIQTNGTGVVTTTARNTVSPSSASDNVIEYGQMWPSESYNVAQAGAGASLFEVQGHTQAFGEPGLGQSIATATNQLVFSPQMDASQAIGIQFSGCTPRFTAGSVSLYDLTAGVEVWDYGFDYGWGLSGITPVSLSGGNGSVNPTTSLLASHQYELTMFTCMAAGNDSEQSLIQLTGLEVLPEPSIAALLGFSLFGFSAVKRKLSKSKRFS